MTLLLGMVVVGLGARNLPAIRMINDFPLAQCGDLVARSLPPGSGGLVLGDYPDRLFLFQAAQSRAGAEARRWQAVDTRSLPLPDYRAHLDRRHPGNWLLSTNAGPLSSREMIQLLEGLVRSNRVFYVHPSYGYFFESFYQRPMGAAYEVKVLPPNVITPPAANAEQIAQTEKFWDGLSSRIEALGGVGVTAPRSNLVAKLELRFHLGPEMPIQIAAIKEWYSLSLNSWGVALQRSGQLPAAARRFNQALQVNPNNWLAQVNLNCNSNLQAGINMSMAGASALVSLIGAPEKLGTMMSSWGLVDDPTCCFLLGTVCQQASLPRQALQYQERARALAPTDFAPEFALAQEYLRAGYGEEALNTIQRLRTSTNKAPESMGLDVQLSVLEAGVWLTRSNLNRADAVLQSAVRQHPEDTLAVNRIAQTYFAFGNYTNASRLVSGVLAREPDNIPALMLQSGILLQTKQPNLAVPVLNHVLSLTNSTEAKLYRMLANIATTNFDAARTDCVDLQNTAPNSFLGEYGLAKIAELQHDTNQAIQYLTICLSNAPPKSPQWQDLRKRLDDLQPPPPK
jgi:tetratricopeptide (TPR) repeat protein